MEGRRSSEAFAALVAAALLLLTAWGNGLALLIASAVGLVIGWRLFSRGDRRRVPLAVLTGAVVAAAIVVLLARHVH